MMTRILVPLEERRFAAAQLAFLAEHTLPASCRITLLCVVEPLIHPDCGLGLPNIYLETLTNELEAASKNLLAGTATRLSELIPGANIETLIKHGSPATEILRLAGEGKFDWIVMGSHGRSGLDKFLLGSVALSVVNRAHCSVSIVRLGSPAQSVNAEDSRQIASIS